MAEGQVKEANRLCGATVEGDRHVHARSRGGSAGTVRLRAVGLAVALVVEAAAAQTGKFDDEMRFLLETHPQIQAAQERLSASEHGIDAAVGDFFPTVTASGDFGYGHVDSPTLRASRGDTFEGRTDTVSLGAEITVFDGFRRFANLDRSKLEFSTQELELDFTRQNVLLNGATAYLDVLRQRVLLGLAIENEEAISNQLALEQRRVRLGSGLPVDAKQAETRLQVARELRVNIEGQLRIANSRYEQVFGHPPEAAAMTLPAPPTGALPGDIDGAVALAREANPRLIASARRIDIAGANVEAATADFFPEISLRVEGARQDNVDGIIGLRRDLTAQVVAAWSLSTGMVELSRVRQAREERAAARSDNTFTDREIADEARIAWHQLQTARERRRILEQAVVSADEVYEARRRLREEGRESVQNVLDAENELNSARIQLAAAQFDERLAVYRLLFAVGTLTPATLGLGS